ncbi:MAG: hypothetical protein GYB32_06060 [Algicola sp.]|nr:hypothetical protein [Algicola sp.]
MMRNFKLFFLSLAIIASFLTACSNNEPVVEQQTIEKSESITTSLNQLRQQFNDDGNVVPSNNPTGNIVFDFCFDFVYPLTLSYNNDTTVTVNSLEDLVQILINSNNELYIDGIAFPFDVETYSEDTDAIVVVTINDEQAFIDLLASCNFENFSCDCYEVYDPVCVEIEAPDGQLFLMTYPNACYAECDGFTQEDFAENCADDYNSPGGIDCFEFLFPLTIITDNNQTITVNSQEELDNALYNSYYFNFQYPFQVALYDQAEVVTINNQGELEALLDDCYGNQGTNCDCPDNIDPVCVELESPTGNIDIISFPNACIAECEGFTQEDFVDCETTGECDYPDEFDPVCVEVEVEGQLVIFTYPNACYAECEGFTADDFVDCESNTPDCTTDNVVEILLSCPWTSNGNTYVFEADGSVAIEGSGLSTIGTWTVELGIEGYPIVSIFAEIGNFNDDWNFLDCNLINSLLVTSSLNPAASIALSCD